MLLAIRISPLPPTPNGNGFEEEEFPANFWEVDLNLSTLAAVEKKPDPLREVVALIEQAAAQMTDEDLDEMAANLAALAEELPTYH